MSGLTDLKIKAFKSEERPYQIAGGNGLYLEIKPNGVKAWRLRYRKHGINTTLVIGEYPQISLREARQKVIELSVAIDKGEGQRTREKKVIFPRCCLACLTSRTKPMAVELCRTPLVRFNRYILPAFADIDISRISRKDVLELLKPLVQGEKLRRRTGCCSYLIWF